MGIKLSLVFMCIFACSAAANAAYVSMIEPYNATLYNNGSILLGKVGPGEPFYVTILSSTKNNAGQLLDYGWNQLVAYGTPSGWVVENSSMNVRQLTVAITPSPTAPNGTYSFYLKAINTGNYSKIGSVVFKAIVEVTPNVFNLTVYPTNISVGPGQPADVKVFINNTGVSDSPFVINAYGAPAWNKSEEVIAPHSTSKVFTYGIYENTPGAYHIRLVVSSVASPLVQKVVDIKMLVKASLANDLNAIGQGAIIFPNIYEPAYSIMYLINLLLKH